MRNGKGTVPVLAIHIGIMFSLALGGIKAQFALL